jgi:DASH complex subunit ASK1
MVDTPEIAETPGVTAEPKQERNNISTELWTDEQETSLFKGIIRWKPAGKQLSELQWCHRD